MALIAGLPQRAPASAAIDLPQATGLPGRKRERMRSIMSSQARRGVWAVPRELRVLGLFSDTTIDFTNAMLPPDIVDLHVNVLFANMQVVVPPGLRVVNQVGAFAANVESQPALDLAPMRPGAPVIRITGNCIFGNLEIVSAIRPDD
jgi:hypothetical protein